jgi:hypothetical protein
MKMVSIWKEFLTVNILGIQTRTSVYMVMFYTFVEHLLHKNLKLERVIPYHPLSSTEAEYYAPSEMAKEVIFAKNLLEEIGIQIQFPINIKCDKVGAIYSENTHCYSQCTKHIDTRRHPFCDWVEEDTLKTILTPTLAKNPTEEIFQKHAVNC